MAETYEKTPEQIYYSFTRSIGMTPLSGTKNSKHMVEAVAATDSAFQLSATDILDIKNVMGIKN